VASGLLGALSACGRISFETIGSATGDATGADGSDGPPASACAPQHVNRGCMVGSATTVSAPFAMPVTATDLLVVAVDYDGTTGQMTIVDTAGNGYTPAAVIARSSAQSSQVWYARAATSGALTVTATLTISTVQSGLHLHEYTDVIQAGMVTSAAGTGTSAATPAIVSADAQGMAFAFAETPAAISSVAPPFTTRETCNGDMTADAPITAGSHLATFTLDSSNEWGATIVELRCN